jgi:hypothetical protein
MLLACRLQSYLAWACIALWPLSCIAIWHQSPVDSSLILPQTMIESGLWGTSRPADDSRLSAPDRSPNLLLHRKEGVALVYRAQEPKLIAPRLYRRMADSHRVEKRVAFSSPKATRRNGGRSVHSSIPGKHRQVMPDSPADPPSQVLMDQV